jgi:hypothetical protein
MKKFVEVYAADQNAFFNDFAKAYGKLLSLGCPAVCDPFRPQAAAGASAATSESDERAARFREYAMHGSVYAARKVLKEGGFDVNALEPTSGRTVSQQRGQGENASQAKPIESERNGGTADKPCREPAKERGTTGWPASLEIQCSRSITHPCSLLMSLCFLSLLLCPASACCCISLSLW